MEEKTILVLYKDNGKFYKATGKDAMILNYLFDYKIINNRCGFPDTTIDKVIEKLEKEKISYQIIYTDKNPLVKSFKDNRYINVLEMYNRMNERNIVIKDINDYLISLDIEELIKIKENIIRKG